MLDVGHHDGRRVEVKLLDGTVGPNREQGGAWTVDRQAFDMLQRRYRIKGDVLCPYVP